MTPRPHRTLPLLLLLSFAPDTLRGQQLTQANGDCSGAIVIEDTIFHMPDAVRGFGNSLEIKENPIDHKQWFEREHHTTWYRFRVPVTTTLTFDIIPDDPEDDIDFLLFEGAIPGICDKVVSKKVVPLRSNISRNDVALGSVCGLSKDARDEYVRSGVGAAFSKALEVLEGDLFYLVIDYQNRPRAGYTIHFHYDPPIPEPKEEELVGGQQVNIRLVDARTKRPVVGNIAVEGMVFGEVVEAKGQSDYSFTMDKYRTLKISCVRKGYMFNATKVKGSTLPVLDVEVPMIPIEPGEHVVLDDIRFVGNEAKPLRSSEASLLLLLRFMQENPNVKIQVEGHVNGPTYKNKKEFVELSTERARSIHDYLMVNDIAQDRISYIGHGNSRMLYPEPRTKEESEANRRVEIKVIGN